MPKVVVFACNKVNYNVNNARVGTYYAAYDTMVQTAWAIGAKCETRSLSKLLFLNNVLKKHFLMCNISVLAYYCSTSYFKHSGCLHWNDFKTALMKEPITALLEFQPGPTRAALMKIYEPVTRLSVDWNLYKLQRRSLVTSKLCYSAVTHVFEQHYLMLTLKTIMHVVHWKFFGLDIVRILAPRFVYI